MSIFKKIVKDRDSKWKDERGYILQCTCGELEHSIQFSWWPRKDEKDLNFESLYIRYSLNSDRQWYKRLWQATKHVLGYKSRYGECGEVVMSKDDVEHLIAALQEANKEI